MGFHIPSSFHQGAGPGEETGSSPGIPAADALFEPKLEPDHATDRDPEDGAKVFSEACSPCHSAKIRPLDNTRLSGEQWKEAIDWMIDQGAEVPKKNISELLDYLVRTHGPAGAATDTARNSSHRPSFIRRHTITQPPEAECAVASSSTQRLTRNLDPSRGSVLPFVVRQTDDQSVFQAYGVEVSIGLGIKDRDERLLVVQAAPLG
jgi:mono/diheme cytochrome c family protein